MLPHGLTCHFVTQKVRLVEGTRFNSFGHVSVIFTGNSNIWMIQCIIRVLCCCVVLFGHGERIILIVSIVSLPTGERGIWMESNSILLYSDARASSGIYYFCVVVVVPRSAFFFLLCPWASLTLHATYLSILPRCFKKQKQKNRAAGMCSHDTKQQKTSRTYTAVNILMFCLKI